MKISITKLNNIQNDVNIYIDGKNTSIMLMEKCKITDVLQRYHNCDFTFNLRNCNDTYFDFIKNIVKTDSRNIEFIKLNNVSEISYLRQLKNMNEKYYLQIESEQEYNELCKSNIKCNLLISYSIYKNMKENLEKALENKNNIIEIGNIKWISADVLEELREKNNIKGFIVNTQSVNGIHLRNFLSTEEFEIVYKKILNYKMIASREENEIKKFYKAYYLVGNNIKYDFDKDGEPSREGEAHSLKGAILNGKAVCEGYAYTLSQLLNLLGIKNECVVGIDINNGKKHIWNQVNIKGNWYNCDITNDSSNIQEKRKLEYCLLTDKENFLYKSTSNNAKECINSFKLNMEELER